MAYESVKSVLVGEDCLVADHHLHLHPYYDGHRCSLSPRTPTLDAVVRGAVS